MLPSERVELCIMLPIIKNLAVLYSEALDLNSWLLRNTIKELPLVNLNTKEQRLPNLAAHLIYLGRFINMRWGLRIYIFQ